MMTYVKNAFRRLLLRPTRVIALGFGLLILLGAVLLNLPVASVDGRSVGALSALFTSASATCVTGLIVVDTCTHWTAFGKCVILFLIQIGGLGFMTLVTLFSLLLRRNITLKERLLLAETLNYEEMRGLVRLVRHILIGTLLIEAAGALILSLRFIPEFGFRKGVVLGVFHSVSSFCNAGFDLMGFQEPFSSLTAYRGDWMVNLTVMALIIVGGLGFVVWEDLLRNRRWSKLSLHSRLVLILSALLTLLGAMLILIFESGNPDTLANAGVSERILAPLFQSVTARTAGYNTLPIASMTQPSLFVMILLMFVGGSPGSTAGGIKTTTLGVILLSSLSVMRGKRDVNLYGRRVPPDTVQRALVIVVIALALVLLGILALSAMEDLDFLAVVFEVVSAFGTAGLTTGVTPQLCAGSKLVLIALMYMGRIGVLTAALAVLSRGNASGQPPVRFPEGKIMIG